MSAPEQIWAWVADRQIYGALDKPTGWTTTSYTRTDVANAMVAAAYEAAAADVAEYGALYDRMGYDKEDVSGQVVKDILCLTPTDAKAALDRLIAEAVKEALERARGAVLAEMLFNDLSSEDDRAHNNAIGLAAEAIETMKGGEA